jgi:Uma2 family endonuclease
LVNPFQMMETAVIISDYEIERGKPMPSKLHSRLQSKMISRLDNKYGNKYDFFSELSLSLDGWDSVPDIAIYPRMVIDYSEDAVEMTEPPLCAIEILSPSQILQVLLDKAANYFTHGVKSCWLVIPGLKNIYVFSNREDYQIFKADQTLTDASLDISLALNEVFV